MSWVLINNNVLSQNPFILLNAIDFVINFMYVLSLYDYVGCVPKMSEQVLSVMFFSDAELLSNINIGIGVVLLMTITFMAVLVLKDFPCQVYLEKRASHQVLSAVVTLARAPFFGICSTMIYGSI